MDLYLSINSPYARKARVAAHELGILDRIHMVEVDPRDPATGLWERNPLAKIPVLVLDDGTAIYDSPVICEYLNEQIGDGSLLPAEPAARWRIRTLVALLDGVMDAGMLVRMENMRPENERSRAWIDKQLAIAHRGLDALERDLPVYGDSVNLASLGVACAIGWLQHRHPDEDWLGTRPDLARWYEAFQQRQSMQDTVPGKPLGGA